MPSSHILKSFDEELALLNATIAKMGELSQTQLRSALDALTQHDCVVAAYVVQADLEIDAIEQDLDVRAIKVLALRQPIARDLREVISALRIASEFERICDYAANIAKRAISVGKKIPSELAVELSELGALALKLLHDVLAAFRARNAEAALAVWAQDAHLDELYTVIYRRLLDFMRTDPENVVQGTHLMFVAKNIERIGDHATNIAESVYYLITGTPLTQPRPKGDTSTSNEENA